MIPLGDGRIQLRLPHHFGGKQLAGALISESGFGRGCRCRLYGGSGRPPLFYPGTLLQLIKPGAGLSQFGAALCHSGCRAAAVQLQQQLPRLDLVTLGHMDIGYLLGNGG